MTLHTLALIGNPNSGKTSLFNALTGARQRTGNWPGVTVERKEGKFRYGQEEFLLVDLPGTYSLDPPEETSADERIAREFLLSRQAHAIVNIVDATHLERALYLSLQLIETETPVCLAVNMMDLAERQGLQLDLQALRQALGVPVVPLVVRRGEGIAALKAAMAQLVQTPLHPPKIAYPPRLEQAVSELTPSLAEAFPQLPARWLALWLLAGHSPPSPLPQELEAKLNARRQALRSSLGEDLDLLLADCRYRHAHAIACQVIKRRQDGASSYSDRIDAIVLNRWLGIPIFLSAIYLLFTFTIHLGGAWVDLFELTAQALFSDGVKAWLSRLGAPTWLQTILADGLGGGLKVVATFIPIIGFLYLGLSFLEDSGYLARAALVMDRLMQRLGLPGKAFIPLIVGFGCNVPAILAARTLERERERLLTVMMAPFMSCSARLAVYALFAAAFFPTSGQNVVFALYLIGILAAILTAYVLKTTLLPGEAQPLLLELPVYQWPSWRNLFLHTWLRLKGFITDAGKYIVLMVMLIQLLNSWGPNGQFGREVAPDASVLSQLAKHLAPAFAPLGIREDNWPAVVGVLSGVLAKEVVVGTLDALYSHLEKPESAEDFSFDLLAALKEAAATVPDNLTKALSALTDPLGLGLLKSLADPNLAAAELEAHPTTFGVMAKYFDGQAGAFAYLLFVLLYSPCVAAIATIRRETGWRWMVFAVAWATYLAYAVATWYYQLATYAQHPLQSQVYLSAVLGSFLLVYAGLKVWGRAFPPQAPTCRGEGPGLIHRSCCK
jgi:ferrous iron transport protein B